MVSTALFQIQQNISKLTAKATSSFLVVQVLLLDRPVGNLHFADFEGKQVPVPPSKEPKNYEGVKYAVCT